MSGLPEERRAGAAQRRGAAVLGDEAGSTLAARSDRSRHRSRSVPAPPPGDLPWYPASETARSTPMRRRPGRERLVAVGIPSRPAAFTPHLVGFFISVRLAFCFDGGRSLGDRAHQGRVEFTAAGNDLWLGLVVGLNGTGDGIPATHPYRRICPTCWSSGPCPGRSFARKRGAGS